MSTHSTDQSSFFSVQKALVYYFPKAYLGEITQPTEPYH